MLTYFVNYLLKKKQKFLFFLTKNTILATSGGQDSSLLIILILILRHQWNIVLLSIFCHHLWQKDTILLSYHVLKIQYWLKIEVFITFPFQFQLTELKARDWRYKFLQRLSFFSKTQNIFIGHTSSDQIESFFFNLCRGCGIIGMNSLNAKRQSFFVPFFCFTVNRQQWLKPQSEQECFLTLKNKNIVLNLSRPLLLFNRYEISIFLKKNKIPVFTDQTNFRVKYFRNRIRYEILPILRYYLNPTIDKSILRFINIFDQETLYLNFLILKIFEKLRISNNQIDLSFFLCIPFVLKKRFLILICKQNLNCSLNSQNINKIIYILMLTSKCNVCPIKNLRQFWRIKKNLWLFCVNNSFQLNKISDSGSDGI